MAIENTNFTYHEWSGFGQYPKSEVFIKTTAGTFLPRRITGIEDGWLIVRTNQPQVFWNKLYPEVVRQGYWMKKAETGARV